MIIKAEFNMNISTLLNKLDKMTENLETDLFHLFQVTLIIDDITHKISFECEMTISEDIYIFCISSSQQLVLIFDYIFQKYPEFRHKFDILVEYSEIFEKLVVNKTIFRGYCTADELLSDIEKYNNNAEHNFLEPKEKELFDFTLKEIYNNLKMMNTNHGKIFLLSNTKDFNISDTKY